MKRIWRENGLSIVMLALFLVFLIAQSLSGYRVFNEDQQEHGEDQISFARYLTSGHFMEATFENWESEFLQMGAYVLLTVSLRQKGSSESKSLSEPEPVDQDPRSTRCRSHSLFCFWCRLYCMQSAVRTNTVRSRSPMASRQ
jgi:hypothetical protein